MHLKGLQKRKQMDARGHRVMCPALVPKDIDGSAPMGTTSAGDEAKSQLKAVVSW